MTRLIVSLALFAALLGTALVASEPKAASPASPAILNDVCPVSGEKLDPAGATADFEGWTIGFCCSMCAAKWEKLNEDEKYQFAAKFAPAGPINAMCPIGKEPIVLDVPAFLYQGHAIGTCCPGCQEQFMAWSEADRDAFVKQHTDLPFINDMCPMADDPIMNDENPSVVFMSARIAFCCPHCQTKWNALPNAKRVAILEQLKAKPKAE